jgi:hypothetical protein
MSFVAGATEAEVYARKAQLSRLFTARPEFQPAYDSCRIMLSSPHYSSGIN